MDEIDFSNSDTCRIVKTNVSEYNELTIEEEDTAVPCLFRFGLSSNQNNYVDNIGTDAHCYVDLNNSFIQKYKYRLEGLYLSFNRYGDDVIWYKIAKCIIGRTLLTENEDNCVHLFLSKIIEPEFAS